MLQCKINFFSKKSIPLLLPDLGTLSAGFLAWQVSVVLWSSFLAVIVSLETEVDLLVFSTGSVEDSTPLSIGAPEPSSQVIWKKK